MAQAEQRDRQRVPEWLSERLLVHRNQHGPHYGGHLSDHLPMALLAMWANGAGQDALASYATRYRQRLDPPVQHVRRPPTQIAGAVGDVGAYGSLLAYFDREVARAGTRATLENWLPRLLSGWVRFAFHPVIRLAYGIRFDVASEIVAGLAYLASAGPDPALQALADGARHGDEPLSAPPFPPLNEPFERRYNATVASGALAERVVVVPDNRCRLAELSLAVFNDTHDFFALHMVTGTHALAVCADAIDMEADGLLSAGLLAAYITVGAPRFDPAAEPRPASIDDEHDAKLAFACADLARSLGSKAFEKAAQTYGDVRLGSGN